MIHPTISTQIVEERTRDLVRQAEHGRLVRMFRRSRKARFTGVPGLEAELAAGIAIRPAQQWDEPAIARLAELDGRSVPSDAVIVAEHEGDIVAARSLLGDEEAISDPFRHTGLARALLALRAEDARRQRERSPRSAGRSAGRPVTEGATRSDAALC
jgi:hypothetical protein